MKPASVWGKIVPENPERERDTGEKLTAKLKTDVNILSHFPRSLVSFNQPGAILDPGNGNNSQLHHGG